MKRTILVHVNKLSDAAVFKMGVDTPDILHTAPRLGEVRVINHQAGIVRLVVTADDDLSPKLAENMVQLHRQ